MNPNGWCFPTRSITAPVVAIVTQPGFIAPLDLAKSKLNSEQFETLCNAIPEMGALLSDAPKTGAASGMTGGKLGAAAGLAGTFKSLGLNAEMSKKVIPMVLDYVKGSGNEKAINILAGTVK